MCITKVLYFGLKPAAVNFFFSISSTCLVVGSIFLVV